jgi:hypothetical protein
VEIIFLAGGSHGPANITPHSLEPQGYQSANAPHAALAVEHVVVFVLPGAAFARDAGASEDKRRVGVMGEDTSLISTREAGAGRRSDQAA